MPTISEERLKELEASPVSPDWERFLNGTLVTMSGKVPSVCAATIRQLRTENEGLRTQEEGLLYALRKDGTDPEHKATLGELVQGVVTERDKLRERVRGLESELDPPVCRLQFPDGSVPGNAREAAEGWKRWYDKKELAK